MASEFSLKNPCGSTQVSVPVRRVQLVVTAVYATYFALALAGLVQVAVDSAMASTAFTFTIVVTAAHVVALVLSYVGIMNYHAAIASDGVAFLYHVSDAVQAVVLVVCCVLKAVAIETQTGAIVVLSLVMATQVPCFVRTWRLFPLLEP